VTALWYALITTLCIVAPLTGIALIGSRFKSRVAFVAAGTTVVVTLAINWPVFYFSGPAIGFSALAFWSSFGLWFFNFLLISVVLSAAATVDPDSDKLVEFTGGFKTLIGGFVALLLVVMIFGIGGVFTQDRASYLASQAKVTVVNVKPDPITKKIPVPESDSDHILLTPVQVANYKAKQAFQGNLGTLYTKSEGNVQSVGGHFEWEFPLGYD